MFAKMKELFVRLLVILATPLDDDQTAIWSIPKPLAVAYFIIFPGVSVWTIVEIVQVRMAGYCGFVWTVAGAAASGSDCVTTWNTLVRETAAEFAPTGIGIAIGTMVAMYGVAVLMGIYGILTNAFTKPIIERHITEGRAKGHAEGRDEGKEEANRAWRKWYARRMEAEANGLSFDEPMPDESGTAGG